MLVAHEQTSLLHTLIDVLSKEKLWSESSSAEAKIRGEAKTLGGVAAVIATLVENTPSLQANLVEWLVSTSANAAVQTHLAHRAIIVVVASNNGWFSATIPMFELTAILQSRPSKHCRVAWRNSEISAV